MFGLSYSLNVLIRSIIIGAVSGYLAGVIMKKQGSLIRNILLGFAGSFVGGIVFGLLGLTGFNMVGQIIISVVGACIVIAVVNAVIK